MADTEKDDGLESIRQVANELRQQGYDLCLKQEKSNTDQRIAEAVAEVERVFAEQLRTAVDRALAEGKEAGSAEAQKGFEALLIEAEAKGHRIGVTDTIAAIQQQAMSWDGCSMTDAGQAPMPVFLQAGVTPTIRHCPIPEKPRMDGEDLTLPEIRKLGGRVHWSVPSPEIASKTLAEMGFHYSTHRALKARGINRDNTTVEEFLREVPLAEFVTLKFVSYGVWTDVRRVFGSHVGIEVEAMD